MEQKSEKTDPNAPPPVEPGKVVAEDGATRTTVSESGDPRDTDTVVVTPPAAPPVQPAPPTPPATTGASPAEPVPPLSPATQPTAAIAPNGQAKPDATPTPEEPAKAAASPPQTPPPEPAPVETSAPGNPPLTEAEQQQLLDYRLTLSRVQTPDEIFQYLRKLIDQRKYRGAALAMEFETTNYKTLDMRQTCLSQWKHIIERLDRRNPGDFPENAKKATRVFQTVDSEVVLEFVRDANNCWQIGANTIVKTDQIYLDVKDDPPMHDPVARLFPAWVHRTFFGLSYYKWMVLGLGFLGGLILYWVIQETLYRLARARLRRTNPEVTELSRTVWRQIALVFMAFAWFLVFSWAVLDPKLYSAAFFVYTIFVTIMLLLILMKVIDIIGETFKGRLIDRYAYSPENVQNLIVPMFSRTMKTLLICVAVGILARMFGWPLAAVISGLGIGGIAVAFAAKETVANLFGSVTVMVDRPFEIGDWIVTNGVEGTVVSVGMRSTRIDTGDYAIVTIPNNNLTTAVITNRSRRRYRRYKTYLTLQYDTSVERMDAFCEGIKELILKNAFTVKEGFAVCLANLGDSSVDVLLNVVLVCPSTETENRERAKLLRNILKLAEAMDVRFAYPSRTLYMDSGESPEYKALPEGTSIDVGKQFANELLYPQKNPEDGKVAKES